MSAAVRNQILEFSLQELVFGLISAARYSPTRLGFGGSFYFLVGGFLASGKTNENMSDCENSFKNSKSCHKCWAKVTINQSYYEEVIS